ncbi:MAG: Sec-independent protein translocase subunit TatA/TatB [Acidimicrobiia bacterium]
MPSLGPLEIIVIMVVALLVFGPNKLPEVARQVGRGLRELRHFQESITAEFHEVMSSSDESVAGVPPSLPPVVAPPPARSGDTPSPTRPGSAGSHAPSRFRAPNQ